MFVFLDLYICVGDICLVISFKDSKVLLKWSKKMVIKDLLIFCLNFFIFVNNYCYKFVVVMFLSICFLSLKVILIKLIYIN